MIQICRAEHGEIAEFGASLWELERLGDLESQLEERTGIAKDSILAYLADGRRLKDENVRDIAGLEDQTIYVFNKRFLDMHMDDVLEELWIEPTLQPQVEDPIATTPPFRLSQFAASHASVARVHHDEIKRMLLSMHYQHAALRISSGSLDLHVLGIADAYEQVIAAAERELSKQEGLLTGLDADLEIVSRVAIHKEFMNQSTRKAMEVGDRARTLGDYVSRAKMKQVVDSCAKTHDEQRARLDDIQHAISELNLGTDEVRAAVSDTSLIEDAEASAHRAQDAFDRITDLSRVFEKPGPPPEKLVQELRQLDGSLRGELQFLVRIKNSYTEQCISAIRRISTLNTNLADIPPTLIALQSGFKAKNSFAHIQRLHNMLYAYGATVIEIVRRKEFARFFYQRASSILEVMAKLSVNERKRRQLYRGDVHGQLPFETRGMDDPVPTIDFSPNGSPDPPYSLERPDIDALMKMLDDLEHFAQSSQDTIASSSVREARNGLERLVSKMDSLESGFDRIAERSLLSASRLSSSRRRSPDDDLAYAELEAQLQELKQVKLQQEAEFERERTRTMGELTSLRQNLSASEEEHGRLERDLHAARAQLESESKSRRILEERNSQISTDADNNRLSLSKALADATEQAKAADSLRQELAQVRAEFEAVKTMEQRHSNKISSLLEEQALTLTRLEEARARGEDLEMQIQDARSESEDVKYALSEAGREKDRLLRAQASEHDRLLRDHIAEADGDRAVLEHQFSELKVELETTERHLKDARAQAEMAYADNIGLREELQRVEHELREARHAERVLRDDLREGRASQSDYELQLENSSRLVAQILDVALAFRESHLKAVAAAQAMSSHPANKGASSTVHGADLTSSGISPGRHNIINYFPEPSPIDPSDPAAALEALRAFDHDHFMEAINKTGSVIRRWQKQCKEYRERAKGKISFRNFAKGDLALFLPTRNSVSKPWAAFNVSFPHYFLQATGHLAEQLKTREWIVARITSITERVVDYKDQSTNPYGLGDGVKYYMLEVEDWTQPTQHHPSKRRDSGRKSSAEVAALRVSASPPDTVEIPSGPPEAEVEDSFSATRPPTSRLFPSRGRANSSPTAGPSSLSRLLAQAGSEPVLETIPSQPRTRTPSPLALPSNAQSLDRDPSDAMSTTPVPRAMPPSAATPPPTATPFPATSPPSNAQPPVQPPQSSPLRPGSRASRVSRVSSSSKFSSRIPFGNGPTAPKGIATTAISQQAVAANPDVASPLSPLGQVEPISGQSPLSDSIAPSPEGSPTEGLSHVVGLAQRRRTSSYHPSPRPRPTSFAAPSPSTATYVAPNTASPLASFGVGAGASASSRLASLASNWGVSFGRRASGSAPRRTATDTGLAPSPSTPTADSSVRSPSQGP